MSTVNIAVGDHELEANQQALLAYVEGKAQIESPQAQLARLKAKADKAETRCAEAAARVDALEMELARGSSEIAQIRLIHAGMWDSWQAATAELERSSEKCRMLEREISDLRCRAEQEVGDLRSRLEQEIGDLRCRAAELDTTLNALYASTSWRITAPVRWLRRTLSRQR